LPDKQIPAPPDYACQVREYLAYCEAARGQLEARGGSLDRKYHPTAGGAVRMIPHTGDRARAAEIRRTFAELTGGAVATPAGRPASRRSAVDSLL
jgi:hypothetical protein